MKHWADNLPHLPNEIREVVATAKRAEFKIMEAQMQLHRLQVERYNAEEAIKLIASCFYSKEEMAEAMCPTKQQDGKIF